MVTHLDPDILECKLKWALGNITANKTSGGDGIPAELFQILNDDTVKVLHSICQQIWKTPQWSQDWKTSVFILIPKKGSAKECLSYHTMALSCTCSKKHPSMMRKHVSTLGPLSHWRPHRSREWGSQCQAEPAWWRGNAGKVPLGLCGPGNCFRLTPRVLGCSQ